VPEVRQCPFCELRFASLAELQMHIELDHPDRKVPDRTYGIRPAHRRHGTG
jgi:hypothetical protein